MIQIDALLAEAASEPPCGPDLEYDNDFLALDQLSRGKPEQQFGETVIPAEEPDWPEVGRRAEALLHRSKDLRVAALLARSLVHTEQFSGLQTGLDIIVKLLERYWDGIHPKLDSADSDPTMRMNALATLADSNAFLRDVRQAALVRSRTHGQLLVRDVEVAHGKLAPRDGETPLSSSHLDAVLAGAAAEGGFSPDWVSGACSATKSLSSLLAERAGADRTLDLNPLLDTLLVVEQACKNALPDATFAETAGAEVAGGAPKAALSITGEIGSRQDALMLVDKIISYFERNEPSNPAPLLLKRAKRLMTMNFVDIIKDLVPDGMDRIQTITGISREE